MKATAPESKPRSARDRVLVALASLLGVAGRGAPSPPLDPNHSESRRRPPAAVIRARRRLGLAPRATLGLAASGAIAALLVFALAAGAAPPTTFAPAGEGAGQVKAPVGVAVDQSSGDLYVADENNHRIDKFDPAGHFLFAFGYGVSDGADEFQTCTSTCLNGLVEGSREGAHGIAPGEVRPVGVAVDQGTGDVYVSEAFGYRVQRFSPTGQFELMFGAGVEQGPHHPGDICTAADLAEGDTCGAGSSGTGPGMLGLSRPVVSVATGGAVWVGDRDRLEQFSATGAFVSEVALPGAGEVEALAVGSSDDFYLISSNVEGVQKLTPSGEPIEVLDAAGHPNALGLDPATGDLFLSDQLGPEVGTNQGTATLLQYDPAGTEIESFGSGQVAAGPRGNALALGDAAESLYLATGDGPAQLFHPLPEPGVPLVLREAAGPVAKTTATLTGELIPEGHPTTYHFEYLSQAQFEADGDAFGAGTVQTTESASLGEDFRPHQASQPVSGLAAGTTYHLRLVATNEDAPAGVPGQGTTFTPQPPFTIDATYAGEISSTGATLGAEVDPLGEAASYHFEYLTQLEYEQDGDSFAGPDLPVTVPVPDASLPPAAADLSAALHISGLAPATTYRYRVAVRDPAEPAYRFGATPSFTTLGAGAALGLPDHRAYEMVSPVDKNGGSVDSIAKGTFSPVIESSLDGQTVTFGSHVAFGEAASSPP
uniref:NHL repeat-containing protein n=1 Tax=Pseudomonas sp. TaxID=306 RepID=UPI002617EA75